MAYDSTDTTEFMPLDDQARFIDEDGRQFKKLYNEGEEIGPNYDNIRAVRQGETRAIDTDIEGWPLAVFDDYDNFFDPSQRYRARADGTVLRNRDSTPVYAVDSKPEPKPQPRPQPAPVPAQPAQQPPQDEDDNKYKTWFPFVIIGGIIAAVLTGLIVYWITAPSGDDTSNAVNPTQQQQPQEPQTVTRTVEADPTTETETTTVRPRPVTETQTETETETRTETITETEILEPEPTPSDNNEPSEDNGRGFNPLDPDIW